MVHCSDLFPAKDGGKLLHSIGDSVMRCHGKGMGCPGKCIGQSTKGSKVLLPQEERCK